MATVEILSPGSLPAKSSAALAESFVVHAAMKRADAEALLATVGDRIRGVARGSHFNLPGDFLRLMPKLEIVANFGVGYDGIDLAYAAEKGIVVTNTPDVLTEEVADTALGLLLMTVRELGAAERHVRAGKWPAGNYPLTKATLRDRTVGIVGLGRIGLVIADRLRAMNVGVAYHSRRRREDVGYPYYATLLDMAKAVDTLLIVLPGGAETKNMVDRAVLDALGPTGIVVNIGRGSAVDEPELVRALKEGRIMAAGLDVFVDEPHVPPELLTMENVVVLPHVGSASVHTRDGMGQLMVDNLRSWFETGKPLTPVAETPWPRG